MSKDGYYGDFDSLADEQQAYRQYMDSQEANAQPDPCPMGCGDYTDDPYGGPCTKCWDKAPRGAA